MRLLAFWFITIQLILGFAVWILLVPIMMFINYRWHRSLMLSLLTHSVNLYHQSGITSAQEHQEMIDLINEGEEDG